MKAISALGTPTHALDYDFKASSFFKRIRKIAKSFIFTLAKKFRQKFFITKGSI
jgi:hypothetical protein